MLTLHTSWFSDSLIPMAFVEESGICTLSEENRLFIRKYITRDKAIMLLNLWEVCLNKNNTNTVWNFMDTIVTSASSIFGLVSNGGSKTSSLWVLEKKTERLMISEMKNVRYCYCCYIVYKPLCF